MTRDEADARLRAIHDEWRNWCSGPGASVSFSIRPAAIPLNVAGKCGPLMHAAVAAGKDGRGWTRFACQNCGVFLCYGPPAEPSASRGNVRRDSRRAAS